MIFAYYNEFDPKAAAWIRQLIKNGMITDGVVDERSIIDVEPSDLKGFQRTHFFAGIAGWERALQLANYDRWDVKTCTASLPCQPFSVAGAQKGVDDERHLLPHFIELVKQCNFQTIFREQVPGAIKHGWLDDLCTEMEREKYRVGQIVLTAAGEGAPHIRQRLYWVATAGRLSNTKSDGSSGGLRQVFGAYEKQQACEESGKNQAEQFINDSGNNGVADSINKGSQGRLSGWQDTERKAVNRYIGCSSTVDGMENTVSYGQCERAKIRGGLSGQHQDGETCDQFERRSEVCRMGISSSLRLESERAELETAGATRTSEIFDGHSRMGNTEYNGQFTSSESGSYATSIRHSATGENSTSEFEGASTPRVVSEWAESDWLYCRDEKYRPIKSSIEPLANGLPKGMGYSSDPSEPIDADNTQEARVMRLKGYGNAIVPQVAASFIKAFMEAT